DLLLQPSVVEGLSFAQATVQTPCGALSLCWKQDAAGVTLTVEVPWNSTVQLVLPKGKAEYKKITWNGAPASGTNSAPLELASGTHQLVCSY
ncbi:MAG: alpha-L-rhamnosidase C-terminal domain-containing protein, partial [Angelakisella sp.]